MSFMVSSARDSSSRSTDVSLSLKKAIKDYRDELFTGLTEDERKEIEAKINEFMRERSKDKCYDREAFKVELDSFIKGLLKEYGFKGGDPFDEILDSSMKSNLEQESLSTDTASSSNAAADILMNLLSPNNKFAVQSDVLTESDGSSNLVISTPDGLFMKIKIEAVQETQSSQPHIKNTVSDYDKNIEHYFDEKNNVEFTS